MAPRPLLNPLLIHLATAMKNLDTPHTRETFHANICRRLLCHVAEPERYESPFQPHTISEESLLCDLWSMHIQAVAVQEIARVLGWWDANANGGLVPFLQRQSAMQEISDMIGRGVRVEELPDHLEGHYPGYV